MARKTWKKKTRSKHEAFVRYYNQGLPNAQVAGALHCSVRTVCRWKRAVQHAEGEMKPRPRTRRIRQRAYGAAVFELAVRLKQELPLRSAAAIARLMQKEFPGQCPSESTIRKYLAGKGFTFKKVANRQGYVKFQRDKPNDLWQVDIAGVQSVGHLGKLYLIAILDDHARYVVAARYFTEQTGASVLKVLRDAVMAYGRPNQVLADNGTQFRSAMKEYESRYVNLLTFLEQGQAGAVVWDGHRVLPARGTGEGGREPRDDAGRLQCPLRRVGDLVQHAETASLPA